MARMQVGATANKTYKKRHVVNEEITSGPLELMLHLCVATKKYKDMTSWHTRSHRAVTSNETESRQRAPAAREPERGVAALCWWWWRDACFSSRYSDSAPRERAWNMANSSISPDTSSSSCCDIVLRLLPTSTSSELLSQLEQTRNVRINLVCELWLRFYTRMHEKT